MKCDKVKELIPFLDGGSIDFDTGADIREHLKNCPSCLREYSEMNNMLNRMRGILLTHGPVPGPEYLGMVRQKILKRKNAYTVFYRVASAAAMVVLTVSLALFGFESMKTQEPESEIYVMSDTQGNLDEYIVSQYMNAYELNELVEPTVDVDEQVMINALLTNHFDSITPEDIIEMMSEDQLTSLLTIQER